jgi:hypothetical protein
MLLKGRMLLSSSVRPLFNGRKLKEMMLFTCDARWTERLITAAMSRSKLTGAATTGVKRK